MATNSFAAEQESELTTGLVVGDESRAEFIAKIGVVEEEADKSAFWMELIIEGNLLPASKVDSLLKEADELVAIMAASRISAARAKQSAIANRKSEI